MVDMKLLGENIRHVRKIKGLTQEELAKKAGMSTMSIRRYENGERIIKLGALKRIAAALNTPIHNLIPNEPGILDPLLPDGLHGLAPNELKVDEDTLCYMLDQMIEVEQINPGLYQRLKAALYFLAVSSGLEHILVYYGSIYDDDEIDLSSPKAKEIIEKLTSDAIFLMKTREDEFNTRMNTAFFELNFTGQQEACGRINRNPPLPSPRPPRIATSLRRGYAGGNGYPCRPGRARGGGGGRIEGASNLPHLRAIPKMTSLDNPVK